MAATAAARPVLSMESAKLLASSSMRHKLSSSVDRSFCLVSTW